MDGTTQKREASLMFLLPLGCVFFLVFALFLASFWAIDFVGFLGRFLLFWLTIAGQGEVQRSAARWI